MKYILLYALLFCLVASGCKKKGLPELDPNAPIVSGSLSAVSGTISPAGAVDKVLISGTDRTGLVTTLQTIPDSKGYFKFSNVSPARYSVAFLTTSEFIPMPEKSIELSAGKVGELGTISFTTKSAGSVRGSVMPANAAIAVNLTATINGSQVSFKKMIDANGGFAFDALPSANYVVGYELSTGYIQPDTKYANVAKGVDLDLGRIDLASATDCGIVTGKVLPLGTATLVWLRGVSNSNYSFSIAPDLSSGAFSFPNVPKGSYSLSCASVSGMIAPSSKTIAVNAGASFDAGILSFEPNLLISLVSCKVNGTSNQWTKYTNSYSGILTATLENRSLAIDCASPVGVAEMKGKQLRIALDDVAGPGSYTCKNTNTSFIGYNDNAPSFLTWPGINSINNGEAKVVITTIDPVQKVVSGTFSATLFGSVPAIKRELTEGSFKVAYK